MYAVNLLASSLQNSTDFGKIVVVEHIFVFKRLEFLCFRKFFICNGCIRCSLRYSGRQPESPEWCPGLSREPKAAEMNDVLLAF